MTLIKTRFSPSPTGLLHLGNMRAALFSYLFALKNQGHFILRIEDTDAARSKTEFTTQLLADLTWLGLQWQEGPEIGGANGPYFQSQRYDLYDQFYQKLEAHNQAYPCFCTDQELALNRKLQLSRGIAPRYPGTCLKLSKEDVANKISQGLKPALRFKVPANTVITFNDLVKGSQTFKSDDIGDFIIRRADGSASFFFCNAIDDSLMGVTHVLRGEDHLTNTPRQLMILSALNLRQPTYGHLSLIVGEEGGKLSKREGSVSLKEMHDQGYLPVAINNYLARLGHTYDSQQLLSLTELANQFQVEKLSKSAARFDHHQLSHWQKTAVMSLTDVQAWNWLGDDIFRNVPADRQALFLNIVRPNILFPAEAKKWLAIFFKKELPQTDEHVSIIKKTGENFFIQLLSLLNQHQFDLKIVLQELKNKLNVSGKQLFMPIRIVLTGEQHGPELNAIVDILGKEKVKQRIEYAIELSKVTST